MAAWIGERGVGEQGEGGIRPGEPMWFARTTTVTVRWLWWSARPSIPPLPPHGFPHVHPLFAPTTLLPFPRPLPAPRVSLDLLPIPVLRPSVTGGYTIRRFDTGLGEGSIDRSGPNLGAGLNLSLSAFRLFGEARYEMVRAPERQAIVRIGVLFGG